jgi:hypothetical protein
MTHPLSRIINVGTRCIRATDSIFQAAKLRRSDYAIAQVHGPLFQQFQQIASAAVFAAKSDRTLAIDTSMYDVYPSSPDVSCFVDSGCKMLSLPEFPPKRQNDPGVFRRADWRRGLKSVLAPTLVGYRDLAESPKRGSVILHGFSSFDGLASSPAEIRNIFKKRKAATPDRTGQALFTGQAVHDMRVQFDENCHSPGAYMTDKGFALEFLALLDCARIVTNNAECAFWLRLMTQECTRIELRG